MRFPLIALALLAGCYSPDLGNGSGFFCHLTDSPACPDGQTCKHMPMMPADQGRCVQTTVTANDMAGGLIPKMGPPYTGMHTDPGLTDVNTCPDFDLEPNDSPQMAKPTPTPTPDAITQRITGLAICPKGIRPQTGAHDVDYWVVDTSAFTNPQLYMKVDLFYDITFGDLDLALFDKMGNLLASDGTAVSNGCVTSPVGKGIYYAVVTGANDVDVNNYSLLVRTFSTQQQCTINMPLDMSF